MSNSRIKNNKSPLLEIELGDEEDIKGKYHNKQKEEIDEEIYQGGFENKLRKPGVQDISKLLKLNEGENKGVEDRRKLLQIKNDINMSNLSNSHKLLNIDKENDGKPPATSKLLQIDNKKINDPTDKEKLLQQKNNNNELVNGQKPLMTEVPSEKTTEILSEKATDEPSEKTTEKSSEKADEIPSEKNLAEILKSVVQSNGFKNIRELELRLLEPAITLYGLMSGQGKIDQALTCKMAYDQLISDGEDKFTGCCGIISEIIKDVISKDDKQQKIKGEAKKIIDAINTAEDSYMRLLIGGHSVIIEKKGSTCRLYQSYLGKYALEDYIDKDLPMPTEQFVKKLSKIIDREEGYEELSEELFHGESVAKDKAVELELEIPSTCSDNDTIKTKLNSKLDGYKDAWDEIKGSDVTVQDYISTHL